MFADSELNVDIGLEILVDKSLIQMRPSLDRNIIEMHCLVEEMGKEIVRAQSKNPGKREFLTDPNDVCTVLEDSTCTKKVLGISLDTRYTGELQIHKEVFKGMRNLRFLNIYNTTWLEEEEEAIWHIPEGFDYFPPKLKLLRLDGYPMRCMPSKFRPENLVKLQMWDSKLEKLWDGIHSLAGLKIMNLSGSKNLKEIPNLSMATNLEKLCLAECSSLVELPSSIQHLNKLESLNMHDCENLETLPTGINLQSLDGLYLWGCSRLTNFPDISTNISKLDLSNTGIEEFPSNLRLQNLVSLDMCTSTSMSQKMWNRVQPLTSLMTMLSPYLTHLKLCGIPSLVEFPSSLQNFSYLEELSIEDCTNLETLPTGINLRFLIVLFLNGCSRLRTFPDISTNISQLWLNSTGVEEVPHWIEKLSRLQYLYMQDCNKLKYVSLNISKLKLLEVDFMNCESLIEVSWNNSPSIHSNKLLVPGEVSFSLPDDYFPRVMLNCINCCNLDQEALLQKDLVSKLLILQGEEVPSYFTHRTTETSLAIPWCQSLVSQQFLRFQACAVVGSEAFFGAYKIHICFRFTDRLGNYIDYATSSLKISETKFCSHLVIFDYCLPLQEDNARLPKFNYDHVDIQFPLIRGTSRLYGCGIRFLEDSPSLDNRPCSSHILPHVYEGSKSNMLNFGKSCDRAVERRRNKKRARVMRLRRLLKKLMTCYRRVKCSYAQGRIQPKGLPGAKM